MTLVPLVDESYNGQIWRMEIDERSDTLFLEIRDNAEKQVSFASINLDNGNLNFRGLTMPERWLTGIECAFDGILLLHNYQSESTPAHKGVIALNGGDGKILWADYNLAFDHLTAEGPVLYDTRFHPKRLLLADMKTGATKRFDKPSVKEQLFSNIVVPEIGGTDFLPRSVSPILAVGNLLHYLEHNNYRIVSLHTSEKGQLSQLLVITNKDNIIHEDLLNAEIQKIQPEAFIMHKNRLIYVKNKTELIVIVL